MDSLIVAIICVVSLIAGLFALYENDLFSMHKKMLFVALAVLMIVEICGDTFLLIIDGKNLFPNDVYKLLKIIELIFVPVIPTLFSLIISHREFWKRMRKVFVAVILSNILLHLTTFLLPLTFNYENSKLTNTQYTTLYIILIIISTMLFLVCSTNTFGQSQRLSITLVSIVILILTGMILRMIDVSSNADWLCITLSYFIFLFHFTGIYLKIDPLTVLLNRKAYDTRLEKIKYDTAIIVIDANNFKHINDTYGHIAGDKALVKIAKIIYSTMAKYGYCYRIGGDEFCVILKKNSLGKLIDANENYDAYQAVGDLIHLLEDNMRAESEIHPMLSEGVACGFGIYTAPVYGAEPDYYKPIEEVIKIADERMYRKKERMKTN